FGVYNSSNDYYNIVIRPRPEVDYNKFTKLCRSLGYSGYISRKGSINPWIHASELVVHDECTTAIESALSNKLALSLGDPGDNCAPVKASTQFFDTHDDACDFVLAKRDYVNSGVYEALIKKTREEVARYFYNSRESPTDYIVQYIGDHGMASYNQSNCESLLKDISVSISRTSLIKGMLRRLITKTDNYYSNVNYVVDKLNRLGISKSKVKSFQLSSSVYLFCQNTNDE
ncbi:MAG: hypothetical protein SVR94_14310, partial [Pseudomonadota bacterium]|nr:hypothetical protein [Pseudomonadota bacterium]